MSATVYRTMQKKHDIDMSNGLVFLLLILSILPFWVYGTYYLALDIIEAFQ